MDGVLSYRGSELCFTSNKQGDVVVAKFQKAFLVRKDYKHIHLVKEKFISQQKNLKNYLCFIAS